MDISKLPPRYKFTGQVHAGGQGNVYVCEDLNLDRLVAIKEMNPTTDPDAIINEIVSLKEIASKHVVEVYDIISDPAQSVTAIVLEYVPGDDLTEYASNDPSESDYIETLYQVANGIADMHDCGKVHRDIKHNNMKYDAEGIVKIFDFGLCKDDSSDAVTMYGHGTDGYRAPELYAAPPAPYSRAVDVYAFGALAWWLAEGEFPQELKEKPSQQSKTVRSISTCPMDLPPEIVALLDSTLCVDANARPSMVDVRDIIARRLLFGRHRANFSTGYTEFDLSTPGKAYSLNIVGVGNIVIRYDGLKFFVETVSGDVFVNNSVVTNGQSLPGSCVITIGAPHMGANRTFVTFDISHPEVVL